MYIIILYKNIIVVYRYHGVSEYVTGFAKGLIHISNFVTFKINDAIQCVVEQFIANLVTVLTNVVKFI